MRRMNLDPTFAPYVQEAMASRPVPLHLVDVADRRAQIKAAREESAPAVPPGIRLEWTAIELPHRKIRALTFRPEGKSNLPSILYCHGGGWMYGNPEQSQELAFRYVQEVGAIVISPEYRLTPDYPFPAAFDDCYGMLRWMSQDGGKIGIDPSRLAVAGESAGATLAAACAIEARDTQGPRIKLQVLNYPALDTDFNSRSYNENADAPILSRDEMIYFWRNYLAGNMGIRDPRAVPLAVANFAGLPPAHITVAEYDPLRDDGVRFAEKLQAAGGNANLVHAKRLTHGFLRALSASDDVVNVVQEICAALRNALHK
jgi:acetyl esterase